MPNVALRKNGSTTVRQTKADLAAELEALRAENEALKSKQKKGGNRSSFYTKVGPSGTMVVGFGGQRSSFYPSQIAKLLKDQVRVIDAILDAEHKIVPEDQKEAFKAANEQLKNPALSFRSMEERDECLSTLAEVRAMAVKLGEDSLEERIPEGEA